MKTMILPRGATGSGKTTLMRRMQRVMGGAVYCSADLHFEKEDGQYAFNAAELPLAHAVCLHEFRHALAEGRDVIVDNTNIRVHHFRGYIEDALRAGYVVLVVEFTPEADKLEQCIERNVHGCDREVVLRHFAQWEELPPDLRHCPGVWVLDGWAGSESIRRWDIATDLALNTAVVETAPTTEVK